MDLEKASVEQLIRRANDIRRGADEDPNVAFKIAKRLADSRYLEHARRLAHHIHDDTRLTPAEAIDVRQKWALWTSKNPDGPDDTKHDEALKILDGIKTLPGGQSLDKTKDQETLGIAGGICKRRWFVDGQRQSLEQSLLFYEHGAKEGIEKDNGYTAINAAFVQDLLASLKGSAVPTMTAQELRHRVLNELLPIEEQPAYPNGPPRSGERWFQETIAEAYFGLGQYREAGERLRRVNWSQVKSWELETTARQFAWLARLQDPSARSNKDFQQSASWQVLRECFGGDATKGAGSLFAGKLGLALSGGGFRASFFHVGVLAGLAELDVLRHVEVLSCVSGGSILGAHYYLEFRKLLQEHDDISICREDYIKLVERLANNFQEGVQKNLRTRVASSVWANLRMMFVPGYTRTNRLGALYEKHLFSRVKDRDAKGHQERRMRELRVHPKGDENCKPKYDNWRRSNKVPILILNATTLNTGHNWQFTATWMGEPPSQIESRIDGNYRLRRMYLASEAPSPHRDITIGQAAAASSCVPGLFTPLELRNLYKGTTVRLVDGGVHDNQGVFGLLDQNCTVFIISDASGQMAAEDNPKDSTLGVLLRSNSTAMTRARAAQYRELDSRKRSGRLKSFFFLHLKDELPVRDRDWIGCDNLKELTGEELRRASQEVTTYSIMKPVQEKIANIRTDLDSFNETEAFALMTSGCNMVRTKFTQAIEGFSTDSRRHEWKFLMIEDALRRDATQDARRVSRLLDVACQRAFKVWRLSPWLRAFAIVTAVAVLFGLGWVAWQWRDASFLSRRGLAAAGATTTLTMMAGSIGLASLVRLIRYRKTIHQILIAAGLIILGAAAAWIHLILFDPRFLVLGRLDGKKVEKG